jgi:hypothetical protein
MYDFCIHSARSERMQGNSSFTSRETISTVVVLCVSVVRGVVLFMSLLHNSFYDTDPVEGLLRILIAAANTVR